MKGSKAMVVLTCRNIGVVLDMVVSSVSWMARLVWRNRNIEGWDDMVVDQMGCFLILEGCHRNIVVLVVGTDTVKKVWG